MVRWFIMNFIIDVTHMYIKSVNINNGHQKLFLTINICIMLSSDVTGRLLPRFCSQIVY